jgi:hypothetical protein
LIEHHSREANQIVHELARGGMQTKYIIVFGTMNPYFIIQVYNERCNLFQSINLADFLKKNDANSIVHERPVRV